MRFKVGVSVAVLLTVTTVGAVTAQVPSSVTPRAATAADDPPMVPPAGPGVFSVKKVGPNKFHLVVAGHKFTSRADIEKYLAYRAAQVTIEQKGDWFTFVENRAKGET